MKEEESLFVSIIESCNVILLFCRFKFQKIFMIQVNVKSRGNFASPHSLTIFTCIWRFYWQFATDNTCLSTNRFGTLFDPFLLIWSTIVTCQFPFSGMHSLIWTASSGCLFCSENRHKISKSVLKWHEQDISTSIMHAAKGCCLDMFS